MPPPSRRSPPPLDYGPLDALLGYQLRRAQTLLFGHVARQRHRPVTVGEGPLLVLVGYNAGISQTALGRALGVERATVGEIADRLVRRGLIERRSAPDDSRVWALHLTARGQRSLRASLARVQAYEARAVRHLSTAERRTLLALLKKLSTVLTAPASTRVPAVKGAPGGSRSS